MKRTVLAGILWLLLFAQQMVKADQFQKFILKGRIKGLKTGTILYLVKNGQKDTVAMAQTSNGNFVFKGTVKGGTDFFYLRMDTSIVNERSSEFLLVNSILELDGDITHWPKVNLKGSNANEDFLIINDIWTKFKEPERTIQIKAYISAHTGSLYLPFVILNMKIELEDKVTFYNQLTNEAKSSYFGNQLFEHIELARKRAQIKEGSIIPDFKVKTLAGGQISIRALAAYNKYTLIDFWASWCKPCREGVPNLKKVYAAFRDRGFNIFSVALGDKESDWKKAVAEDQTPWFNGRDIDNLSYKIFDITTIPGFALIDQQGKLIAFNCVGSQIQTFGPDIKGDGLYQTLDKLLNKSEKLIEDIKPLKVGDKMPDIELGEILNHPTLKSAKVSDFKGKLLILDFWGTYCSVCIAQFPHMTELQQKFGNKIQILPVGFDIVKGNRIEDFIAKRKNTKYELKLPTVVEREYNSKFLKYFPQNSQPHEVWINQNGVIIGITDHRAVTSENIQAILMGGKPNFKEKLLKKFAPFDRPYSIKINKNITAPISVFSSRIDSIIGGSFLKRLSDSSLLGRWYETTVYEIYMDVYKDALIWGDDPYRRIITKDNGKPFYQRWEVSDNLYGEQMQKFEQENLFCYEAYAPSGYSLDKFKQFLIQDLDKHFKIRSRVDKIKVKCLALVQYMNVEAQRKHRHISPDDDLEYLHCIGRTTDNLVSDLSGAGRIRTMCPIINEANFKQKINYLMPIKGGLSISQMKEHLRKFGFDLKEVEREMNMLVLENMR